MLFAFESFRRLLFSLSLAASLLVSLPAQIAELEWDLWDGKKSFFLYLHFCLYLIFMSIAFYTFLFLLHACMHACVPQVCAPPSFRSVLFEAIWKRPDVARSVKVCTR